MSELLLMVRPHIIDLTMKSVVIPDDELGAKAAEWRKRALHGDLHARGIAHEFEAELRRRQGWHAPDLEALDLRPLELRQHQRRWWKFW